jgi:hemolysin-activating ACP:hemolysin acyltransferase
MNTLSEWLQIHDLERETVSSALFNLGKLSELPQRQAENLTSLQRSELSFETALQEIILPAFESRLSVFCKTEVANLFDVVDLPAPYLPFTIDRGAGAPPRISLRWTGTAGDFLAVAHELAHAIQIARRNGRFSPPMQRELEAFLGEAQLMMHVRRTDSSLYRDLCAAWNADTAIYLGPDLVCLQQALKDPSSAYDYRHNYPIARVASTFLAEVVDSDLRSCLQRVVGYLAGHERPSQRTAKTRISRPGAGLGHFSGRTNRGCLSLPMEVSISQLSETLGCLDPDRRVLEPAFPTDLLSPTLRAIGVLALSALEHGKADVTPEEFLASINADDLQLAEFPETWRWTDAGPAPVDTFAILGLAIQELQKSHYHRQFKLSYYLPVEILPPLRRAQFRAYVTPTGASAGFVTWAWVSDETLDALHRTGRALTGPEWAGGQYLFMNDIITDPGMARLVVNELAERIFPDEEATSLRRTPNGSIRRINRWSGRNLRQKKGLAPTPKSSANSTGSSAQTICGVDVYLPETAHALPNQTGPTGPLQQFPLET